MLPACFVSPHFPNTTQGKDELPEQSLARGLVSSSNASAIAQNHNPTLDETVFKMYYSSINNKLKHNIPVHACLVVGVELAPYKKNANNYQIPGQKAST